jgi:hypothetical protein
MRLRSPSFLLGKQQRNFSPVNVNAARTADVCRARLKRGVATIREQHVTAPGVNADNSQLSIDAIQFPSAIASAPATETCPIEALFGRYITTANPRSDRGFLSPAISRVDVSKGYTPWVANGNVSPGRTELPSARVGVSTCAIGAGFARTLVRVTDESST